MKVARSLAPNAAADVRCVGVVGGVLVAFGDELLHEPVGCAARPRSRARSGRGREEKAAMALGGWRRRGRRGGDGRGPGVPGFALFEAEEQQNPTMITPLIGSVTPQSPVCHCLIGLDMVKQHLRQLFYFWDADLDSSIDLDSGIIIQIFSIVNYEWEFRLIKFKRVGFTNHVTIHDSRSIYALIGMERECVDEVKKSS